MNNYEDESKRIQKELNSINYIRQNTKLEDPKVVLNLYNKIIDGNLLRTTVGLEFLRELQGILVESSAIDNSLIKAMPGELLTKEDSSINEKRKELQLERERQRQARIEEKRRQAEDRRSYKRKFQVSLILNFLLVVIVVGMFLVSYLSGNNVNIINYENEIINKYEEWEQELNERETSLNEREAQLNNK
ncbi:MAG: hypothetical protein U0K86_06140 [Agathobacter sp.]|nr:hypothetical protein [Agathobacter sp.]